jgi:hypothetical protein
MMGALSWLTGVGLPTLAAFACFAGAAAAWFRVPVLGHYFGLALACVGVALIANAKGFSDARDACKEAAVRAELAQARRDIAIMAEAADKASELSSRLNETEQRNADLARKLTGSCLLNDDDARRLRDIREPGSVAKPSARP